MFSSITVAMAGTVLLFEEQREKGVVEVNPGGPVLLLGLQKKPFSPMYSAQIRSSRTFRQKQIPSSYFPPPFTGFGFDGTPFFGISTPEVHAIALRMSVRQS